MLRAPHFLILCCIAVLSEFVAADKGNCPTIPKTIVRWDALLKNVNNLHPDFPDFMYVSYYWDTIYDSWKMRCDAVKVPPKPSDKKNHVEGVIATDNKEWLIYMYCDENDEGHNKTIETFTTNNIHKLNPNHTKLYKKVTKVHKLHGFKKDHFYECLERQPIEQGKKIQG